MIDALTCSTSSSLRQSVSATRPRCPAACVTVRARTTPDRASSWPGHRWPEQNQRIATGGCRVARRTHDRRAVRQPSWLHRVAITFIAALGDTSALLAPILPTHTAAIITPPPPCPVSQGKRRGCGTEAEQVCVTTLRRLAGGRHRPSERLCELDHSRRVEPMARFSRVGSLHANPRSSLHRVIGTASYTTCKWVPARPSGRAARLSAGAATHEA